MKRAILAALIALLIGLMDASALFAEVKFDYGAALRLRQEIWDNVTHLGTDPGNVGKYDRNFFRIRTQLWGKVEIDKNYGAYLRLTNEAKYYNGPYLLPQGLSSTMPDERKHWEEDEIFVDNFYLDFKNVFGLPVDARIGRQDFLGEFGDGFVILDGSPGDGSRSFYFNAAKVIIKPHQNHSITLAYLINPKTDKFMPVLHSSIVNANYYQEQRTLNVSNETGFILYSKNKFDIVTVDPYYIYKTEGAFPVPGTAITTARSFLHTIGGRVEAKPGNWKMKAEYAHQFGSYTDTVNADRQGDGVNLSLGYAFKTVPLKPEVEIGYVYLSGDDPATTKNEGWDPLWSRAPMWNELYIYTIISETVSKGGAIPGYWSNLQLYRANFKVHFTDATNLMLGYNYMRAVENSGLAPSASQLIYSNSGKERGHLFQSMLSHKFNKNIDAFIQAEHFLPGNYYQDQTRNATFFRWQLQFRI
ncbi:MAG TPA: alginate export family protein [Dissulfurispiraceae bacterium]|nr:alginate export family protein [Dissulfurispiraceae bacterium]